MTRVLNDSLLAAALSAAERGWPVFPLRPGSKRPAGHPEHRCPHTGRCAGGHRKPEQRATTDRELIELCWAHRPYGIGLATGPARLLVVDLDVPKDTSGKDTSKKGAPGGAATFEALCERAGQRWPHTYTVRTPSGGLHLYFTTPPGAQLRNSQARLGTGIDTRAWGGYVAAAGTTLPTGPYRAELDTPALPLPAWLHRALTPQPTRRPTNRPLPTLGSGTAARYVEAALQAETAAVATATEGGRNAALTRAARALGRFVASGQLARPVVEDALKGGASRCGLPESDANATITSALNWSITHNNGGAS